MEIAVITPDTLSAVGLRGMFASINPDIVVRTFPTFGAFADDTPDMYAWYFISSQMYVLYNFFFLPRKGKTVLLMPGIGGTIVPPDNHMLNIFLPEQKMKVELVKFLSGSKLLPSFNKGDKDLSVREIEVLMLISKGLINKEIADKLNISLTTVITHRKNITHKLGIKSVPGLTMYAVMNGYAEI
ncbi:MAG: helix-turn-helix transcriptional regulator [Mediterranea sp.]|jgi:DNA-binding CsgD family transcriptional regulator|nr:helix-turn-helix transcriptional regulator [Mediterranea sp.]